MKVGDMILWEQDSRRNPFANAAAFVLCPTKSLILSAKIFSYSCELTSLFRESINSYYADAFPSSYRSIVRVEQHAKCYMQ